MGMQQLLIQRPRRSSGKKTNTAWIERVLEKHWQALSALVGEGLMPICNRVPTDNRLHCTEYGCGLYGCVMPTASPDVVCKVTSDPSEAAFVSAYLESGERHLGVVRYDWIVELPETYLNRRTFAIWRQPANNVGMLESAYLFEDEEGYDARARYDARFSDEAVGTMAEQAGSFREDAAQIQKLMKATRSPEKLINAAAESKTWAEDHCKELQDRFPSSSKKVILNQEYTGDWKPAQKIAWRKLQAEDTASAMSKTEAGVLVGGALRFYLSRGMLLADVHRNNIGEVTPDGYSDWELVITDPGHMVPLDKKWLHVKVPQLYG